MNHGRRVKNKANENEDEGDTSDEEEENYDDDRYKFTFLQHDVTCSIQDRRLFT